MPYTQEEIKQRRKARKTARMLARKQAEIEAEKGQREVKELTISITWAKSRVWGNNPHAEVQVGFHNGEYERREGYTCSGCGYDKESTVIAQIFDDFLKYKLWTIPYEKLINKEKGITPYGIVAREEKGQFMQDGIDFSYRGYSGGIGTSCYTRISEFIGGKFEHVASGKSFDVYKYTDGKGEGKAGC